MDHDDQPGRIPTVQIMPGHPETTRELMALTIIGETLDALTPDQRDRVLTWAAARRRDEKAAEHRG